MKYHEIISVSKCQDPQSDAKSNAKYKSGGYCKARLKFHHEKDFENTVSL